MAWTNVFDTGSCTVIVCNSAGNVVFSSVLGKGDSGTFSAYGTNTVAVSSDGYVTLTAADPGNLVTGAAQQIYVKPSSDISGLGRRCRNMVFPSGIYGRACANVTISGTSLASIEQASSTNSGASGISPDPLVVATTTLSDTSGLYTVVGGGTSSPPLMFGFYLETGEDSPPPPVANDISEDIAHNYGDSSPTVITPVVTESGSPVTPTSISIVTPPTNGSATVVGETIEYTPTVGYHGADLFTFTAVYGGQTSNEATASLTVAVAGAFWRDTVACDENIFLVKRFQQVFVAGHAAVPYRPYSKTCPVIPPVTPPKRWVTKTLCGTYSVLRYTVYLSLGGTGTVQETMYDIPGLPSTSVFNSGPPPQDWSGIATPYPLPVIATGPYCKTVTVYE